MQLPWIFKTLGKVKVVPMAIGNIDDETVAEIAKAIKKELHLDDVVIVSSDFTHYGPRFDYQPFDDEIDAAGARKKIAGLTKKLLID